ncbi:hypothetical protein GJV82_06250 [Cellulosimicrobium sp. BIT-GX5]|uniref:Uncharacterized protein n=1 Tax=Cellulosimicrobium composti TaxID=2672572 RepID=A0A6N7ZGU1_9MICO|nr:hypothetical protein [Cellulosimicrobium composti]MTG88548.1 hypothetical protein [Cellulosimicrobium composti]
MTAPEPAPSAPPARRATTAAVVLAGLVVLGAVLLGAAAWVASRPVTSGWFAYAPEAGVAFRPSGAYPVGAAALLAGAGALLLGGVLGFVLGRRDRPTVSAPGPAGRTGPAPSGPGDDASPTP